MTLRIKFLNKFPVNSTAASSDISLLLNIPVSSAVQIVNPCVSTQAKQCSNKSKEWHEINPNLTEQQITKLCYDLNGAGVRHVITNNANTKIH